MPTGQDPFLIYIDRLAEGEELLDIATSHDFLAVQERHLSFKGNVHIKGKAYLVSDELALYISVRATACMPCTDCNRLSSCSVVLENFYHIQPLSSIPSHVFDMREALREAILLNTPEFIQCSPEGCLHRKEIEPYLRSSATKKLSEEGYQPFKDLTL